MLAAAGVPTELVESKSGTADRESWRRFLFGSLGPMAATIQEELRRKLEVPDLSLSFRELRASDLAGRARAFQSMVGGGMEPGKAAALSGLVIEAYVGSVFKTPSW